MAVKRKRKHRAKYKSKAYREILGYISVKYGLGLLLAEGMMAMLNRPSIIRLMIDPNLKVEPIRLPMSEERDAVMAELGPYKFRVDYKPLIHKYKAMAEEAKASRMSNDDLRQALVNAAFK